MSAQASPASQSSTPASAADDAPNTRLTRWRSFRRYVYMLLFVWLTMCVVLALAITGYGMVDHRRPADVIIVLGGGLEPDGQSNPPTTRRSHEAAILYQEGYAPYIICSGGPSLRVKRPESEGCADVLRADGIPDSAIILESESRSTEQNALFSQTIMNERGWKTALIVSDGYHLMRSRWIFADVGVSAYTVPTEELPPLLEHMQSLAREILAYHWQALKEVLRLPYTNVPFV